MKPKNLLFSAFILVAMAQLFVPWQMIRTRPNFIDPGAEFKFKIDSKLRDGNSHTGASIRGKFIWLELEQSNMKIADKKEFEQNEGVFVVFTRDSLGFAKIESVTKKKPVNNVDWIRARVWVNWRDTTTLHINYPFNQYYIKDTNPKDVETIIKKGLNDSLKINYLKIKIRDNQFQVEDLLINDVSFKEMMKIKN